MGSPEARRVSRKTSTATIINTTAAPASLREAAARAGGHATAFQGSKAGGALAPLSAPLQRIHREMKSAFDPDRVFNPGRLYADL